MTMNFPRLQQLLRKRCTSPHTCSRTRRDTNEREHSKSKDKEN